MKFFLIGILTLSTSQLYGNYKDYKDTGALYHDTTKNINQSIALHNNAAAPAKVITTTKIKRIPKYTYYNVYKTKVVWKCITPPPIVIPTLKPTYLTTGNPLVYNPKPWKAIRGNALTLGWSVSGGFGGSIKIKGPCGSQISLTASWRNGGNPKGKVCGVSVSASEGSFSSISKVWIK